MARKVTVFYLSGPGKGATRLVDKSIADYLILGGIVQVVDGETRIDRAVGGNEQYRRRCILNQL